MGSLEIDNTLSGIIVILLLFVMWKLHNDQQTCGNPRIRLDCGCMPGSCSCKEYSKMPKPACRPKRPEPEQSKSGASIEQKETMVVEDKLAGKIHGHSHVVGAGPTPNPADFATDDYESTTIDMALESGVEESHKRYCNSLSFAGIPTGSSSCTTLEETGRSYGTADFVGLTARKFCKARQLATPSDDVRTTPSTDVVEWCDVGMDELI